MIKMYKEDLGYINVTKLYTLEPRKSLKDGLCLLEDDNSIRCMINYIRTTMGVKEVHIYAHHDVDQPQYAGLIENAGSVGVEEIGT